MINKDSAIGVFDSGIGGLTVLHEIIEALPRENTVYLGDTARSPYGTKSVETVMRYSFENSEFLVEKGVKLVVVACNTSTAIALSRLQESLSVPVIGVIEPGVRRAIKSTKNKKVVSSAPKRPSTVALYRLEAADPKIEVYSRPVPLFVPLVEEGGRNAVVEMTVKAYLGSLNRAASTLVLVVPTIHCSRRRSANSWQGGAVGRFREETASEWRRPQEGRERAQGG